MADINATDFDNPGTVGVDESVDNGPGGIIIKKLTTEESTTSGTGVYTPFLKQDATGNDIASQGYNTDDTDSTASNNDAGLDMSNSGTQAIQLRDIPIVYLDGIAYYEFRLDINEENNNGTDGGGASNRNVELSELQIYTSNRQAVLTDYNESSYETRALGTDDSGAFNLVYDLDETGDNSIILRDTNSGSGADDFIFYVPVSKFAGSSADTYVTFFSQFGPTPEEGATFEEWRIQTPSRIEGVKFADINGDGSQDTDGADNQTGTADDEVGLEGFVIYIDANNNNMLDDGEVSTISGPDGSFVLNGLLGSEDGKTYVIREAMTAEQLADYILTTGTDGDHIVTVTGQGVYSLLVGNRPIIKDFTIDKSVVSIVDGPDAGNGAGLDGAGDTINYLVSITNTGNVPLTNVVVGDLLEGSINLVLTQATKGNGDDIFDVGETWTFNASYTLTQPDLDGEAGGNRLLDNVATATAEYNGETVGPKSDDTHTPVAYNPAINVTKEFTGWEDGETTGNTVGDKANYKVVVTNTGNITLTGVTVKDPLTGQNVPVGALAPGESKEYLTSYTITQADLDSKGDSADTKAELTPDTDVKVDNEVTADSNETEEDTATAEAPLLYDPKIDLEKLVSVDGGVTYDDADFADGLLNANVGDDVFFRIIVENKGNVSLTNVAITDVNKTNGLPGVAIDLSGVTVTESISANGILDVGETWTLSYTQPFDPGVHLNTASVTTSQGVGDTDDAYYYSLVNQGPGVRTPGFWSNLGYTFWDGIEGNEPKQAGTPGFADGELLYGIDTNGDGVAGGAGDKVGLLVGDYNHDGFTGDNPNTAEVEGPEDTLFISLGDARTLINASNKQMNDGVYKLGRDVVATWLNSLAGNNIGESSDPDAPKHYLDDAVDWLQQFAGTSDADPKTPDMFKFGAPVKSSSPNWNSPVDPIDHSASQMHNALDHYNNDGKTEDGGTMYAHDTDDASFMTALKLVQDNPIMQVSMQDSMTLQPMII